MIQRVQTLFLLGVAICMILVLVFPIWSASGTFQGMGAEVELDAFNVRLYSGGQIMQEQSTFYIAALAILAALNALFSIFQFKKRSLQVKLNMMNALVISAVLGCYFIGINKGDDWLLGAITDPSFKAGFFMPLIALILDLMANRFIKKDEKLVKSMDRLR